MSTNKATYIVVNEVVMVVFYAIVEDGNYNILSGDASLPRSLYIHVCVVLTTSILKNMTWFY